MYYFRCDRCGEEQEVTAVEIESKKVLAMDDDIQTTSTFDQFSWEDTFARHSESFSFCKSCQQFIRRYEQAAEMAVDKHDKAKYRELLELRQKILNV